MNQSFQSELIFTRDFPSEPFDFEKDILIYDQHLLALEVSPMIALFKRSYGVQAGESLKQLSQLENHLQNVLELNPLGLSRQDRLIAMGGGSVGDFVGFMASILKRGIRWANIPTTWLAAIDSAHGGKTALNFAAQKNQLGTFYPAEKVFLVENILSRQPEQRWVEAYGELFKMSLIAGNPLFEKLNLNKPISIDHVWSLLPLAIEEKYKIVLQDPYEKTGLRQILNLGHTVGHVLEAELNIPHGVAIFWGLGFAVEWSRELKFLNASEAFEIQTVIEIFVNQYLKCERPKLTADQLQRGLMADKKRALQSALNFILLKGKGDVFVYRTDIDSVVKEAARQGWLE